MNNDDYPEAAPCAADILAPGDVVTPDTLAAWQQSLGLANSEEYPEGFMSDHRLSYREIYRQELLTLTDEQLKERTRAQIELHLLHGALAGMKHEELWWECGRRGLGEWRRQTWEAVLAQRVEAARQQVEEMRKLGRKAT